MKWRPLLGLVVALASAGCGPSPADLARWEASEPDGLERLERVVVDRAAKPALRADAALLMIRAERRGRRPGLERLAEIVAHAPAADATPLLEQLVPRLSAEIRRDGAIDGIAEKDFAVLLLLDDAVAAAPLKAALRDAVLVWVRTATLARLAERRQRTSVPQAVRLLGAPAVEPFPALVGVPDAPLPLLATLVRDVGAPDTRAAMAGALIARDERLASPAGAAELRRAVDEANAKSGARPAAALVDAQLAKHRARVRGLVFEALIALGEPSARAHVVDRATAAAEPGEVRRAALAAMGVPAATSATASARSRRTTPRTSRRASRPQSSSSTRARPPRRSTSSSTRARGGFGSSRPRRSSRLRRSTSPSSPATSPPATRPR